MPLAGHPTLGTAYVVHELSSPGDTVLPRMPAGDIPVRVAGDVWTLQANAPVSSPVDVSRQGSAIQRPSVLDLMVDDDSTIFVSGAVREVGRGTFTI